MFAKNEAKDRRVLDLAISEPDGLKDPEASPKLALLEQLLILMVLMPSQQEDRAQQSRLKALNVSRNGAV